MAVFSLAHISKQYLNDKWSTKGESIDSIDSTRSIHLLFLVFVFLSDMIFYWISLGPFRTFEVFGLVHVFVVFRR